MHIYTALGTIQLPPRFECEQGLSLHRTYLSLRIQARRRRLLISLSSFEVLGSYCCSMGFEFWLQSQRLRLWSWIEISWLLFDDFRRFSMDDPDA